MNIVNSVNEEYLSIVNFLDNSKQPSLSSDVNKYFKKVIILSSASYFEHQIQEILIEFVSRETKQNQKAISFFKKKAIAMQYHTYFNWGEKNRIEKPGNNANSFFSLFGSDFKKDVELEINADEDLENSIKSFIEIGHLRNILVHSNFAAFNLDNKTTAEVFELHQKGIKFVEFIRDKLR